MTITSGERYRIEERIRAGTSTPEDAAALLELLEAIELEVEDLREHLNIMDPIY